LTKSRTMKRRRRRSERTKDANSYKLKLNKDKLKTN
jgi:hypothetical protein